MYNPTFSSSQAFPLRQRAEAVLRSFLALSILLTSIIWLGLWAETATSVATAPSQVQMPLAFTLSDDPAAPYTLLGVEGKVIFNTAGLTLALPQAETVELIFTGASFQAALVPMAEQPGVVNRYTGSDPAQWRVGLPTYGALTYSGLYSGIDLRYEGMDGRLKGTYHVAAGSDPSQIRWQYQGAQQVQRELSTGDLLIQLSNGRTIREQAPIAWQEIAGQRTPVDVQFTLNGQQASFALGGYDAAHALIIDPTFDFGTFLGADGTDDVNSVTIDSQGNIVVTGTTYSPDFPGGDGQRSGNTDMFVVKLSADGKTLLYSTFIEGNDDEMGNSIASDGQGGVWVVGETESEDFPLKSPLNPIDLSQSFIDGVALHLNSSGAVLFSTAMGSAFYDVAHAVTTDAQGNAYVVGEVSAQFGMQGFVVKLAADGSQELYTFLFGAAERGFDKGTKAYAVDVDAQGNAYVTGSTSSIVFPVVNGFQTMCAQFDEWDCWSEDAFVLKLNPAGNTILYSTFLGGSNGGVETGTGTDEGHAIAVGTDGSIYVAGQTFAPDFPVKNAFQPAQAGAENFSDGFLVKFNPSGSAIEYSTYLGGKDWEEVNAMVVDDEGNVYLGGFTSSKNFPVSDDAMQRLIGAGVCIVGTTERYCYDGFLFAFSPTGARLWATYVGGNDDDILSGLALSNGGLYVAGKTESRDHPSTEGSYQPFKALNADGYILKIGIGEPTTTPPPPPPTTTPPPPGGDSYHVFLPRVGK